MGNYIIVIYSFEIKDYVYFEKFFLKLVVDEFYIMIEDGSVGRKGYYFDVLKELIE